MLLKLVQFENPKFKHLIPNYGFEINRNLNLGLKKKKIHFTVPNVKS